VESVQKHLDALGYDPGTTDGTESVMTEVAISQFQAENGLPVTGKVTPQLLGILSATVDK
jgi:peptidoglycan hydrolase-like protein with peptidoglycan-binding domain